MKPVHVFSTMILFFCIMFTHPLLAQNADSTQAGNQQIVELGATEIKIAIEAPQVKLFTNRIKPEFDEVNLDKSFREEIIGQGEQLKFENKAKSTKPEIIDISKLISKLR